MPRLPRWFGSPEQDRAFLAGRRLSIIGAFDDGERVRARRTQAVGAVMGVWDAASNRFREIYGLTLPRHVASMSAFFLGLSRDEPRPVEPIGVGRWFGWMSVGKIPSPRLDERLDGRMPCDPPEFVPLAKSHWGWRWGLYFDSPADESPAVVEWRSNERRLVRTGSRSMLEAMRRHIYLGYLPTRNNDGKLVPPAGHLRTAARGRVSVTAWLDALVAHRGDPAAAHLGALDDAFPAGVEPLSGLPRPLTEKLPDLEMWVSRAQTGLRENDANRALRLGLELLPHHRDLACSLLIPAYRALGRAAFAELLAVQSEQLSVTSDDLPVVYPPAARGEHEPLAPADAPEVQTYAPGVQVIHARYGVGVIQSIEGQHAEAKVEVTFKDKITRKVLRSFLELSGSEE